MSFEEWYETEYQRWHNMNGVRSAMDNRYGKGQWGDDEFEQYLRNKYDEYRADAAREDKQAAGPPMTTPDTSQVDQIVQKYLAIYEEPAPNDMVLLRQMAAIECQLPLVQHRLDEAIAAGDQVHTRTWSTLMTTLTKTHRELQETLGIDRPSRDKGKSRDELVEYVQDVIKKAGEFIDENAVPIRCHRCMESQSHTEIDLGFILFHFRQDVPWSFQFQCPMCGETIRLP